ncbi:hypothetical protein [Vibrio vulnificus]|uniref:hypothetical protein n=1 Tax=Vibrio vulnificus TaxID=672 RepID=UPI00107DFD65|nr:hypothetical protein [Vibrio vulnificus]QBH30170.1 Beta-galactosidase / Beta-glucosidase/6-phospho-beta-glucosidase [Vibrio vulnificus]
MNKYQLPQDSQLRQRIFCLVSPPSYQIGAARNWVAYPFDLDTFCNQPGAVDNMDNVMWRVTTSICGNKTSN